MATVLLHLNTLSFLALVTHCLKHMLPLHLWSSTGQWDFIMGRQLNMLEIKSANIGRAEGSQVEVSIMFMCLADISYRHSVGIMEASFVGSCLTEFNNKAIFGYKLHHSFLTQQLKEKKKKINQRFCSPESDLRHLYRQRPLHAPQKQQLRTQGHI